MKSQITIQQTVVLFYFWPLSHFNDGCTCRKRQIENIIHDSYVINLILFFGRHKNNIVFYDKISLSSRPSKNENIFWF